MSKITNYQSQIKIGKPQTLNGALALTTSYVTAYELFGNGYLSQALFSSIAAGVASFRITIDEVVVHEATDTMTNSAPPFEAFGITNSPLMIPMYHGSSTASVNTSLFSIPNTANVFNVNTNSYPNLTPAIGIATIAENIEFKAHLKIEVKGTTAFSINALITGGLKV